MLRIPDLHQFIIQPESALWDADSVLVFERLAASYDESSREGQVHAPTVQTDSRE